MTTAINFETGILLNPNGRPSVQHPRPVKEWWSGDQRLTLTTTRMKYFRTADGREWRFHRTDDDLALLRQNGRERRDDARPPAELRADPKWAGKLAERRTTMTIQKTKRVWRWATLELRPTLIAYYGFESRVEMRSGGDGLRPHFITKTTYALHKTDDTPHAFPLTHPDEVLRLYNNRTTHRHPSFTEIYTTEQTRQRTDRPDLSRHIERGTHWTPVAYESRLTTYSDGRPSKMKTEELGGKAEYPQDPTIVMLTQFSTKADAKEIPTYTTHNPLDYGYKFKTLYANLEATRRLKAEVKREICEAVLHPDRIDRMATKFELHPSDYLEMI